MSAVDLPLQKTFTREMTNQMLCFNITPGLVLEMHSAQQDGYLFYQLAEGMISMC